MSENIYTHLIITGDADQLDAVRQILGQYQPIEIEPNPKAFRIHASIRYTAPAGAPKDFSDMFVTLRTSGARPLGLIGTLVMTTKNVAYVHQHENPAIPPMFSSDYPAAWDRISENMHDDGVDFDIL